MTPDPSRETFWFIVVRDSNKKSGVFGEIMNMRPEEKLEHCKKKERFEFCPSR